MATRPKSQLAKTAKTKGKVGTGKKPQQTPQQNDKVPYISLPAPPPASPLMYIRLFSSIPGLRKNKDIMGGSQ